MAHDGIFGMPGVLRRPLAARIEAIDRVHDEVHATYGGVREPIGIGVGAGQ